MRIAIFIKNTIYHGSYGGLETQNENLVAGLRKVGQEVVVFTPALDRKTDGYVFVGGTTPGRYDSAWWQKSLAEFEKRHLEKPFDIVISQSAAGAAIIAHQKEFDVKTIVVAHGTMLGEVKTVWKRTRSLKDVYRLARSAAFGIKTYFTLDRRYLNDCDHIVAVSEVVKSALTREFGLVAVKITVIPNGVDVSLYQVARQDTPEATFLYFGRIEREKGVEILVKAFDIVHRQTKNTKLKIVGNGPDRANVVNQIKLLNLQDFVTVLSKVDYQEIPNLLASVNVFVLPSLRVEGLPMTLVESAAAGLPLLASDIGGNRAVVKDSLNGFLVKSGDVGELTSRISEMAKDAGLRERLGKASRKIAEENFSRDKMVDRYLGLIKL